MDGTDLLLAFGNYLRFNENSPEKADYCKDIERQGSPIYLGS